MQLKFNDVSNEHEVVACMAFPAQGNAMCALQTRSLPASSQSKMKWNTLGSTAGGRMRMIILLIRVTVL